MYGPITRSCNGIDSNVNFQFVLYLSSNFIFVSSQSGYCSSAINYFFNNFSATIINFQKPSAGGERVAESNIVPNLHVFIEIFGQEI